MRIGIFDSGMGGLTVLKEALKLLPNAHFIYFGDTGRFPYGTKSPKTIEQYSIENTLFLLQKQVDVVVIACNTATSIAYPTLQKHFSVPIIDVIEPAIETALKTSSSGNIGIIGTTALVQSKVYQNKLKLMPGISLSTQACPLLISLIEEGMSDKKIKNAILDHYLKPLKKKKIDTLILACTHFPLIQEDIQEAIGQNVQIINPSTECAKRVHKLLKNTPETSPQIEFYVSDDPKRFKQKGEAFLGFPIHKVHSA